jgi:hypothetical protein
MDMQTISQKYGDARRGYNDVMLAKVSERVRQRSRLVDTSSNLKFVYPQEFECDSQRGGDL